MGERKGGGRVSGRRRGGTGVPLPRRGDADLGVGEFEARFGAALRVYDADPEAERRAVAAFRGARAAGTRPSRTRPRDDWRPTARRRALRTVLSVTLASLALGGAATAAIGSAGSGTRAAPHPVVRPAAPAAGTPRPAGPAPSSGTVTRPSGIPRSTAPAPRPPRPATARDTPAHCRAHGKAGRWGQAPDATAWRQIVAAAGDPELVAAHCATPKADKTGKSGGSSQANDGKK
ncbi:hypothetical protein SAMN04490357_4852 [Streptomyces misionensis]|uniref:Uncharacterized protein n=1 Tax=Streptomyces misionensis TaxID=67331 RepID=A0A1H5ASV9_9ACTN|nr:hypothetical protein [Streptomyces misionensis]SED45443.1 hypothetical protein SAMN04490357_4852 [Streptomyces misionensis]